jgi:hypothetical protein
LQKSGVHQQIQEQLLLPMLLWPRLPLLLLQLVPQPAARVQQQPMMAPLVLPLQKL